MKSFTILLASVLGIATSTAVSIRTGVSIVTKSLQNRDITDIDCVSDACYCGYHGDVAIPRWECKELEQNKCEAVKNPGFLFDHVLFRDESKTSLTCNFFKEKSCNPNADRYVAYSFRGGSGQERQYGNSDKVTIKLLPINPLRPSENQAKTCWGMRDVEWKHIQFQAKSYVCFQEYIGDDVMYSYSSDGCSGD